MSPADIQKFTRAKPFAPFRIMVMDGTSYDIPHPEFCMVLLTSVVVGVRENQSPGGPESAVWIDSRHIHKLIPLGGDAATTGPAPQNGTPGS
ncbi:MAG: hypothetical protein K2X82_23725 [Gemmataceae bacterium]|nr:hypothetical protein [Gemmataceae bacterium]